MALEVSFLLTVLMLVAIAVVTTVAWKSTGSFSISAIAFFVAVVSSSIFVSKVIASIEEKAARDAGFPLVEEYKTAKKHGITTHEQWKVSAQNPIVQKRLAGKVERIEADAAEVEKRIATRQREEQRKRRVLSLKEEEKRNNRALAAVQSLPCKTGGTIEQCFNKKASAPVVTDLGWNVREETGAFIVEKVLHVGNLKKGLQRYKWRVAANAVTPANDSAIGMMMRAGSY